MCATEFVLVTPFAGFEEPGFVAEAKDGKGRTMHVSRGGPHTAPARAGCADIIIHLPARSEAVTLVSEADGFDHLATHAIAEIGETVERLQCPHPRTCAVNRGDSCSGSVVRNSLRRREDALFVPGPVCGGTGQTVAWLGGQGGQQRMQPVPRNQGAACQAPDSP